VFFHLGEQFEWDVELGLPVGAVKPVRLGRSGHLGWTSWMAPSWDAEEGALRRDARFHPAESLRLKRSRTAATGH
jgi:type VI secretion system protein ImpH